jgi:hypothetical protein
LSIISGAKDKLITPEVFEANADGDYRKSLFQSFTAYIRLNLNLQMQLILMI